MVSESHGVWVAASSRIGYSLIALRRLLAIACINLLGGSLLLGGCDDGTPDPVDASGTDSGTVSDAGETSADAGNGGGIDSGTDPFDAGSMACTYPAGPVEPMAVGSVLWPYNWPEAIDGTGQNFPIDLEQVACNTDPNIDWSPFDVLVFIAIPAW